MANPEITQLLTLAQTSINAAPLLLVLDEQANALAPPRNAKSCVMSNRVDVSELARSQGWASEFSDFAFTPSLMDGCQQVLYRLSKEKRVVEHVLQSVWHYLPVGGELLLAGYKNEGCKTFAKRAADSWQCQHELTRGDGNLHLYRFRKTGPAAVPLNALDYHALQVITEWQGQAVVSKPGVFAWDRIDEGSRLLLEYLPTFWQDSVGKSVSKSVAKAQRSAASAANAASNLTGPRGLDLGCGYGLLALSLLQAGCADVVATDNNAAALRACDANLQAYLQQHPASAQHCQTLAADCGADLSGKFDVIVCNPPFHQGFAVEQQLTDRFLQITQQLLKKQGRALFVVNSFIPLERKAKTCFAQVTKRLANASYAVFELSNLRD
jgi:16S rRNA (guanine1207-N2)-methyltransferase